LSKKISQILARFQKADLTWNGRRAVLIQAVGVGRVLGLDFSTTTLAQLGRTEGLTSVMFVIAACAGPLCRNCLKFDCFPSRVPVPPPHPLFTPCKKRGDRALRGRRRGGRQPGARDRA